MSQQLQRKIQANEQHGVLQQNIEEQSTLQQNQSLPSSQTYEILRNLGNSNNQPHQIERYLEREYEIIKVVGQGSFGIVRQCKSKKDGKIFAVKTIPIEKLQLKYKEAKDYLKEVDIMKDLRHQNIIYLVDSFVEMQATLPKPKNVHQDSNERKTQCLHIIMEFAENGDLFQMIQQQKIKGRYFSEKDLWGYAWQMCLGVLHLHSHDIIHRDIKCMNLLLTDNFQKIKLGDMSESRVLDHQSYIKTNKLIGTPQSLSPEVIKNESYDQRSDIWALGVSLYHMSCLEPPWQEETMQNLFKSILYKNPKPVHTCYSSKLSEFIFKLLDKKKNNRPLVVDLIDYFSQSVPQNFSLKQGTVDFENYTRYSEKCRKAFDKKRMIESNQISIKNEFSALKRRIVTRGKNFKANYLNYKGNNQNQINGNPKDQQQLAYQQQNLLPLIPNRAQSLVKKGGVSNQTLEEHLNLERTNTIIRLTSAHNANTKLFYEPQYNDQNIDNYQNSLSGSKPQTQRGIINKSIAIPNRKISGSLDQVQLQSFAEQS
eukprot:403369139